MPAWVTAAFASAVFSGVFGSVGLLFRKKIAYILFSISIITLLVHQVYNFFIQDYLEIIGIKLILPIYTTIIGLYLYWYSDKMSKQGVLN